MREKLQTLPLSELKELAKMEIGETVSTTTAETAIMVLSTAFWALLEDFFSRLTEVPPPGPLLNSSNLCISVVCWISSAVSFSSELDLLSDATVFTRSMGLMPSLILMSPPTAGSSPPDA